MNLLMVYIKFIMVIPITFQLKPWDRPEPNGGQARGLSGVWTLGACHIPWSHHWCLFVALGTPTEHSLGNLGTEAD